MFISSPDEASPCPSSNAGALHTYYCPPLRLQRKRTGGEAPPRTDDTQSAGLGAFVKAGLAAVEPETVLPRQMNSEPKPEWQGWFDGSTATPTMSLTPG